jgi:hypothetical protein
VNAIGMTPDDAAAVLMVIPVDERPSALFIGPDDADDWRDYMPTEMRSPRRTGRDPWVWWGYGHAYPIRVHVTGRPDRKAT